MSNPSHDSTTALSAKSPYLEGQTRAALARKRAKEAHESLRSCHLCAHHCGVNRLDGEQGPCHAGATTRFFSAQLEAGDELELIPTFAIALSGCDLRCAFCVTGAQSWNPRAGEIMDPAALALEAGEALAHGARSIMILGGEPTIHLPAVLELVAALPDSARLVWKTNAHGSALAREWLDGIFDVWLADYKFGNDQCAQTLARVPNYTSVVRDNLAWASEHTELIVRHLLMPGHLECCWEPIARWLAEHLPGVKVSLRDQFWPAWKSRQHAGLNRAVTEIEAREAKGIAQHFNLNLVE